ncbi:MAG: GrpE protein [Magnetococcales bacterium]|nr:GrpE protein [Magnetococcales bacterium]
MAEKGLDILGHQGEVRALDEFTQESLIAEFRAFLEETQAEEQDDVATGQGEDIDGDLAQLYLALTGLKNEVRIESRQFKEALDRFRALFEMVETGQTNLAREMDNRWKIWEGQAHKSTTAMFLEFLALRDRLEQSAVMIESHQPSFPARLSRRESAWRAGVAEGQRMLLRRLEQILFGQGITPIATVDRPLDPRTMRVVGVESHEDKDGGAVVAEVLKGYQWNGYLLRAAEVRTNTKGENDS